MTRSTKCLLVATLALTVLAAFTAPSYAGGCRSGGGHRISISYHRSRSHCYTAPRRVIVHRPARPVPPPQQIVQPVQPVAPPAPQQPAPIQQPPAATQQPPASGQQPAAPSTAQPTQPAEDDAEMSALQALAGWTGESPKNAPQAEAPGHVGTWNATLSNGARVELSLKTDGSFRWSATNQAGNASSFQGTYSVEDGSLTLIRSNDKQKLSGSMVREGDQAFTFRLSGADDSGLRFIRA